MEVGKKRRMMQHHIMADNDECEKIYGSIIFNIAGIVQSVRSR
jgi:hypothetical protein